MKKSKEEVELIARMCHEANRWWCALNGDKTHKPWSTSPAWQKKSAINGVLFHLENPDADPADSHNNWMKEKLADGWKLGERKNADLKTHPCLKLFEALPVVQQKKDVLFRAIVHALK